MTQVEVLVSAMYQKDLSILEKTGITTDALLINQCDEEREVEETREKGTWRAIFTKDRGLSRSRNLALDHATSPICLICDDDESLLPSYDKTIEKAFARYPDAAIIAFQVLREGKTYSSKPCRVGYIRSLKIASWQIAFRPDRIRKAGICFDTNFGSGTPRGAGEENIFLFDCLRAGLKIRYVPECIGSVAQKESRWFHGFDKTYFLNRGAIIKRMMGSFFGFLYCVYFALTKFSRYRKKCSFFGAMKWMCQGMGEVK